MEVDSKTCTQCNETKPFEAFCKNKRGKHGRNAKCRECMSANGKAWYKENKERSNAKSKKWHEDNREKHNAINAKWQLENKEAVKESNRRYRQANPDKNLAQSIRYRAAKYQRTPAWADNAKIEAFYAEAKRLEQETGVVYHVDHIIPLKGKMVSGLHVESNLQVIPANENLSKSNIYEVA